MHYFYTAKYDPKDRVTAESSSQKRKKRRLSETIEGPSALRTNIEMFFLADMLLSDRLKSFTLSQIELCFPNPAPEDLGTILALIYNRTDPTDLPFFQPLINFCSQNLQVLCGGENMEKWIHNMQPDFFLRVLRCCSDGIKEYREDYEILKKQASDEKAKLEKQVQDLGRHKDLWSNTQMILRKHVSCASCKAKTRGNLQLGLNPGSKDLPRIECDVCSFACWGVK